MKCHICDQELISFFVEYENEYDEYLKCFNCTSNYFYKCAIKFKNKQITGYILYIPQQNVFIGSYNNNETYIYSQNYPIATPDIFLNVYFPLNTNNLKEHAEKLLSKIELYYTFK